jgi:APA family basic amino acid/polyamine antiporter
MDHKGVFARKPIADIIAVEGSTPRPLRTPWVGILSCLGLLAGLGVYTFERLGIWIAIGLVIYFAYGRLQSRLRTR